MAPFLNKELTMRISKLLEITNRLLAGDTLPLSKMTLFFDQVIDDINSALDSVYPSFSDLDPSTTEYDFFPDNYLRSVVAKGAALKYLTMDEEGAMVAQAFAYDYQDALFKMTRDHITSVPERYQANTDGGVDIKESLSLDINMNRWF